MAFALVNQVTVNGGTATSATTAAIDTTGANLLVAIVWCYSAITDVVTDSKSNTWTALTAQDHGSLGRVRIFYSTPGTVGSGHTATVSGGSLYGGVTFFAFSGADATPFDVQNGALGAGTTSLATGSVTPANDGALLIYGHCLGIASPAGVDVGTIVYDDPTVGGNYYGVQSAYYIQTTASAINPTFTQDTAANHSAAIAAFKAGAGASAYSPGRLSRAFPRPILNF